MRFRVAIATAASAFAVFGVSHASAATFVVTKVADTNGTCEPADCSLREAVKAANAAAGDDTAIVPPGTYTLTGAAGEDLAESGDLDLTDTNDYLLLEGAGSSAGGTTISGGGVDRVFDLIQFAALELRGVRLIGGAEEDGGAIRNHDGDLRIRDSVLEGNAAGSSGGAIFSFGEGRPRVSVEASTLRGNNSVSTGGAIENQDESRLLITNSSLVGNESTGSRGGAIYNEDFGTATIVDSTLTGNKASSEGGAIGTQNESSLTVVRSTLASNESLNDQGGAIWAQNSTTVTVVDSILSGNRTMDTDANDGGGAIWAQNDVVLNISGSTLNGNYAQRHGGGVYVRNFVWLTVQNSTIVGNTAEQRGGGLYAEQEAIVQLKNATIANNTAGAGGGIFDEANEETGAGPTFHLRSTIVAANSAAECSGTFAGGTFTSFGFNLDGSGSCDLTGPGDIPGGNAALGPLAANGGPTQTMALGAGSQAIDAGGAPCPATDQRGFPRPQGAACDIGAYEAAPPAAPPSPPPPVAVKDTAAPRARLLGKGKLRLGKRIVQRVRCVGNEDCIVRATGFLRIQGSGKALRLTPSRRIRVAAGKVGGLVLRIAKRTGSQARRALRQRNRVRALITVRVVDEAGNARTLKRTLGLTR